MQGEIISLGRHKSKSLISSIHAWNETNTSYTSPPSPSQTHSDTRHMCSKAKRCILRILTVVILNVRLWRAPHTTCSSSSTHQQHITRRSSPITLATHTHTHRHAHPHREQRHSSISALQAKLTKSTVAHRRSFRLQPPLQLEERGRPDVVRRSSGRQPPQNKNHMYEFLCRKIVTSSLHYQNQDQCLLFKLVPTNLKQTYCSGF